MSISIANWIFSPNSIQFNPNHCGAFKNAIKMALHKYFKNGNSFILIKYEHIFLFSFLWITIKFLSVLQYLIPMHFNRNNSNTKKEKKNWFSNEIDIHFFQWNSTNTQHIWLECIAYMAFYLQLHFNNRCHKSPLNTHQPIQWWYWTIAFIIMIIWEKTAIDKNWICNRMWTKFHSNNSIT